jgi:hypothetical protein
MGTKTMNERRRESEAAVSLLLLAGLIANNDYIIIARSDQERNARLQRLRNQMNNKVRDFVKQCQRMKRSRKRSNVVVLLKQYSERDLYLEKEIALARIGLATDNV